MKADFLHKVAINKIENLGNENLTIENVNVSDPNNPAKLIEVKLIKFTIAE